jgi:hypothetical protein
MPHKQEREESSKPLDAATAKAMLTTQANPRHLVVREKEISLAAMKVLATWKGSHIYLYDVSKIDADSAEALSQWKGGRGIKAHTLLLQKLSELSADVAEKLAPWKGDTLFLSGLPTLTADTTEKLSQWRGERLYLGVTSLDAKAAEKLSRWKGTVLYLFGLRKLSVEAAIKLSQWDGASLMLEDLKETSDEAIAALQKRETFLVSPV